MRGVGKGPLQLFDAWRAGHVQYYHHGRHSSIRVYGSKCTPGMPPPAVLTSSHWGRWAGGSCPCRFAEIPARVCGVGMQGGWGRALNAVCMGGWALRETPVVLDARVACSVPQLLKRHRCPAGAAAAAHTLCKNCGRGWRALSIRVRCRAGAYHGLRVP